MSVETLNICIASNSLSRGNGIDLTVAEFAHELSKYHNVTIAAGLSDIEIPGVKVERYHDIRPRNFRSIARDIDSKKYDLISSHSFPFDLIASMSSVPHYLHDYGNPPFMLTRSRFDLSQFAWVNSFKFLSSRKVAMVLPLSRYLGREFRKRYMYFGGMDIVPSGIDFPAAEPEPVSGYGKFILFVGRHVPYKKVDRLVRIFDEVKKELGDDVHLVTIGKIDDGIYGNDLKALAEKTGNVHLLGFVPDVWPYYAGASVYATCSLWEGQDRPVLEAQYMGKPAVSYDNCSHPEVMFHGALATNDEEFKKALIRYLSDDRADPAAREKVVERYAINNVAKKFLDIVK